MGERGITAAEIYPFLNVASVESPNTVTAFRLIEAALKKGISVDVFAYEGAVSLTMKGQQQHANPVKGTTVEEEDQEQDDTVLWLIHALKNAGIEISILLRSNAVNYTFHSKVELPSLSELGIQHPPKFAADLEKMASKGIAIYAMQRDLAERGIGREQVLELVRPVNASELAKLISENDFIFHG